MRKFKLYFDKDKETEWLNEMAANGWAMTGFFAGVYTFDSCEPGKYIYQVDFSNTFGSVSEDYRELMRDMDIEIIQSWGYWVLLRREAALGSFDLYTDVDSQIEHYKKIRTMFKIVTILEMLALFAMALSMNVVADPSYWILIGLMSVVVLTLARATVTTNEKIRILKEEQTGIESDRKKVSPYLASGLILNAVRMLLLEKLPDVPAIILAVVAIVLMVIGIAQTSAQSREV